MTARKTTHDVDAPWLIYRYYWPDWVYWAIGRVIIHVQCCICGQRVRLCKSLWRTDPADTRGRAMRAELITEHKHTRRRNRPLMWAEPAANYGAYREWRKAQTGQHVCDESEAG